jgi:hypothetical protein
LVCSPQRLLGSAAVSMVPFLALPWLTPRGFACGYSLFDAWGHL